MEIPDSARRSASPSRNLNLLFYCTLSKFFTAHQNLKSASMVTRMWPANIRNLKSVLTFLWQQDHTLKSEIWNLLEIVWDFSDSISFEINTRKHEIQARYIFAALLPRAHKIWKSGNLKSHPPASKGTQNLEIWKSEIWAIPTSKGTQNLEIWKSEISSTNVQGHIKSENLEIWNLLYQRPRVHKIWKSGNLEISSNNLQVHTKSGNLEIWKSGKLNK